MPTIDLPGGHTATLREPKQMKERHRRLINTALIPLRPVFQRIPRDLMESVANGDKDAGVVAEAMLTTSIQTRQEGNAMLELRDATIIAVLERWDLDELLPTMETLCDLDPELYAALEAGTRTVSAGAMAAAMPTDFTPTEPPDPDAEAKDLAPFGPSANSAPSSKATGSAARSRKR